MRIFRGFMALFLVLALALALPLAAAADTLTATVSTAVQATFTKSGALSTPKDLLNKSIQKEFANGTGSGQANLIFRDQRTLLTGANETLDLAGALTDPFGATLTFGHVKALIIENTSTARTLTVGGAAANAWETWTSAGGTVSVPPGGIFSICAPAAGFAVTAGTGDLLKIANDAGSSCTYNLIIIGTSS